MVGARCSLFRSPLAVSRGGRGGHRHTMPRKLRGTVRASARGAVPLSLPLMLLLLSIPPAPATSSEGRLDVKLRRVDGSRSSCAVLHPPRTTAMGAREASDEEEAGSIDSSELAGRIRAWREEYGDAKGWIAGVLKRVRKRAKHAQKLRDGKSFVAMAGEDDVEDAAFGAYVDGIDQLRQQVEAADDEGKGGNTWRVRLAGFSAKDRFKYRVHFVGYSRDGESARKVYERLETSVRRFGRADSITFWDRERVLKHHDLDHAYASSRDGGEAKTAAGRVRAGIRRTYERDPENGAWAWKPAIILAELERAKPGDFVVYADTSHLFQEGVKHSFVPICDWLTVGMTGVHGEAGLRAGGMAGGTRLRVRNNSPPSRKWFWGGACDMCQALVRGGMCHVEHPPNPAPDGGWDPTPADELARGTPESRLEGCCNRAYAAPRLQSAFSVWQKNPRTMEFVRLWRDLALAESHPLGDDDGLFTALATTVNLAVPYARYDKPYTGPINNDAKDPNLLFQPFTEGKHLPWLTPEDGYPECEAGKAEPDTSSALDVWTECCPDHYEHCMPEAWDVAAKDYEKRTKACLEQRHPHNRCGGSAGAEAGQDAPEATSAQVEE